MIHEVVQLYNPCGDNDCNLLNLCEQASPLLLSHVLINYFIDDDHEARVDR